MEATYALLAAHRYGLDRARASRYAVRVHRRARRDRAGRARRAAHAPLRREAAARRRPRCCRRSRSPRCRSPPACRGSSPRPRRSRSARPRARRRSPRSSRGSARAEDQGGTLGIGQSAAAFGRILGPESPATYDLRALSVRAFPYVGGAALMAVAAAVDRRDRCRPPPARELRERAMPELRRDPIVGRWVIIATERARRPTRRRARPRAARGRACARSAPATRTRRRARCTSPGRSPSAPPNAPGWKVRVVPNRFPALMIEGDLDREAEGIYDRMNGDRRARGRSSRRPTTRRQLEGPLRRGAHRGALRLQGAHPRPPQRPALPLHPALQEPRGSAPAPRSSTRHSQLIALPVVPRHVVEEIEGARRHYEHQERCIFCDIVGQERKDRARLVYENDEFVVFAPWAPRSPFETWIVPKRHESNFEAEPKERLALLRAGARARRSRRLARRARRIPPTTSSSTRTRCATPPRRRTTGTSRSCRRSRTSPGSSGAPASTSTRCRPRRRPSSCARCGARPRAPDGRRDGDPVRRVRGGALVEDGRARRRRGRAAAGARRARPRASRW